MVTIDPTFAEQHAARQFVRSLGVPDATLCESERANPGTDWRTVLHALDGVFLRHGGPMGQVRFLRMPHDSLQGQTPVEILSTVGGPANVCRAARLFAHGTPDSPPPY